MVESNRFFHYINSYSVRFNERKEFHYDPEIFRLSDTQTALRIHAEYVRKGSPRPMPRFFEVDRRSAKIDALWHVPLDDRTVFSRDFEMAALIQRERPDWRLTRVGIVPQQKHKFWLANVILQEMDYFPMRGDMIFYDGYRHMIVKPVLEPSSYWHQTNVWLGLVCETVIPAEGDARPVPNVALPVPAEIMQTRPLPEV
jgi:hypothetical protein